MKFTHAVLSFSLIFGVTVVSVTSAAAQAQGGFSVDSTHSVYDLALQPDGKILAATVNSSDGCIHRYSADGRKDFAFGNGGTSGNQGTCRAIVLQPDGKILLGVTWNSTTVKKMRRLNADGSVDSSFDTVIPDASSRVEAISLAPNGQIYIGGDFTTAGGSTRLDVARLNADGSLDASFANAQSNGTVESMLTQPDGKLVVGGTFTNIGGAARTGIARLNSDGTLDTSFSSALNAAGQILTISRQSDGKLIVGGDFTITVGPRTYKNLVRLNDNGTLDTTFALGPNELQQSYTIYDTEIQPDGKIVVAGGGGEFNALLVGGFFFPRLASRYNPDGSLDSTLRNNLIRDPWVYAVALLPDGKVLLGGYARAWGSDKAFSLARIDLRGYWEVPFSRFDWDGDHRADLSVFRPSNNTWYVNTGNSFYSFTFGESTDLPAPADYDFDGKTDFAVFRQSNGTWYWIDSSTATFTYVQWGEPGDLPVPGNRISEVKGTFDIYRPSNGRWYRLEKVRLNDEIVWRFYSNQLGQPGDIPLVGYWGKNMESLPAVFRPSNRTFNFYPQWTPIGQPGPVTSVVFPEAQPGDIPLVGDYDGDFQSDYAMFRPSNGLWTIRLSRNFFGIQIFWGQPGDIPIFADYDGDRRDDIAVFRPSNGTWYINGSSEWRIQPFGVAGDIPVPSSYVYGD